jgi:CRP/FNR family transcriptional regulator
MNINVRIKCQSCAVRASGLCSDISERAANELSRSVHRRRMPAGQVLYGGNTRPGSYAVIVSGVVKLVHARADGRNQIVGLQFPADFVGRPYACETSLVAEAATDVELCSFSTSVYNSLAEVHPDVERAVLKRALTDLDNARDWMFMLGCKTASERVATLLLLFAERLGGDVRARCPETGEPMRVAFDLPLSRTDFAACLGLRLETVSRQISALRAQGIVAAAKTRAFEVCDMRALRRLSETAVE